MKDSATVEQVGDLYRKQEKIKQNNDENNQQGNGDVVEILLLLILN